MKRLIKQVTTVTFELDLEIIINRSSELTASTDLTDTEIVSEY